MIVLGEDKSGEKSRSVAPSGSPGSLNPLKACFIALIFLILLFSINRKFVEQDKQIGEKSRSVAPSGLPGSLNPLKACF